MLTQVRGAHLFETFFWSVFRACLGSLFSGEYWIYFSHTMPILEIISVCLHLRLVWR